MPPIDQLSFSLDVEKGGSFTGTREGAGSSSKETGTWTESKGKIKMMIGDKLTYTATVDGKTMALVHETMKMEDWKYTLILSKK